MGVNLFEKKLALAAGTTKNGKARTVFMPEPLYGIIRAQYDRSSHDFPKCPYVFHKAGQKIGEFRKAWERALSACGYSATLKCRDCKALLQTEPGQRWKKEGPALYVAEGRLGYGLSREDT
jgi:integrase